MHISIPNKQINLLKVFILGDQEVRAKSIGQGTVIFLFGTSNGILLFKLCKCNLIKTKN